jgi:hypothetical protein
VFYDSPINTDTRVGRQLAALAESDNRRGIVLVTVTVAQADGGRKYHETFAIRQWHGRDGSRNLSVSVHGSADWQNGVKPITCLHLNLLSRQAFEGRDERGHRPLIRYAAHAALQYAWTGEVPQPGNGTVEAVEAARCGRCGAQLTDRESIERGLGPECYGKRTGSASIRSLDRQMQLVESDAVEVTAGSR